jgi:hypothetical protein
MLPFLCGDKGITNGFGDVTLRTLKGDYSVNFDLNILF